MTECVFPLQWQRNKLSGVLIEASSPLKHTPNTFAAEAWCSWVDVVTRCCVPAFLLSVHLLRSLWRYTRVLSCLTRSVGASQAPPPAVTHHKQARLFTMYGIPSTPIPLSVFTNLSIHLKYAMFKKDTNLDEENVENKDKRKKILYTIMHGKYLKVFWTFK